MTGCGIDFGTSNSAISYFKEGNIALAPVEGESTTLPSAIFYPVNAPPVFGRQAQTMFFTAEEGRFMRSLKRILSTELMMQGTIVNGKPVKFEQIIGNFISHIKNAAEQQTGKPLESVVMGRPVHFVDGDDAADQRAQSQLENIARAAGFRNIAFQFEPIAAAFAHETRITAEKLALVVDIGGGTSDFTVIRLSQNGAAQHNRTQDILGNAGIRIGGNDFDKSLSLDSFMPAFGYRTTYGEKNLTLPIGPFHDMSEWSKITFLYTPRLQRDIRAILREPHDEIRFGRFAFAIEREYGHRILSVVEAAKIALTTQDTAIAPLDFIEKDFSITTTRQDFDTALRPHTGKIAQAITECLARAGVTEQNIGMIVLTGGPTDTPAIRAEICRRFPHADISEDEKMSSVALGLGYDCRRIFGT